MTYHAYVGTNAEDVHPEEPDRIVGIHQRLQGAEYSGNSLQAAVKLDPFVVHRRRPAFQNGPDSYPRSCQSRSYPDTLGRIMAQSEQFCQYVPSVTE